MKLKNIRHGDMGLIGIEKLPEGLTASKSKVLMTGSGGNDHAFIGPGTFYPHEERKDNALIVGYFVAQEGTVLTHIEHGPDRGKALREVPVLGILEIRKQNEQTHVGMVPVED